MRQLKGKESMTKNWPGGRRRSRSGHKPGHSLERTLNPWNTQTAAFTRPYWTEPDADIKADIAGGMATPTDGPSTASNQ